MGWDDDLKIFAPYIDKMIYAKENKNLNQYNCIRKPMGDLQTWVNIFKPMREQGSNYIPARIQMAASFAAPLAKIANTLCFCVHVWSSETGSGKTVGLRAAGSVWGDPLIGKGYINTFDNTPLAAERLATFCHNLPVLFDELQTAAEGANNESLDRRIYKLCEGTAKEHGAGGGIEQQDGWQTVILTTGEQKITKGNSKGGVLNRIIDVSSGKEMFPGGSEGMRDIDNAVSKCYGVAGREFVKYLSDPSNQKRVRTMYEQFRKQLNEGTTGTGKQTMAAALLLVADTLATEWIFKDGLTLTVDDIAPYLKDDTTVSTNERAHEIIMEWLVKNDKHFIDGDFVPSTPYGRKITQRNGRRIYAIMKNQFETMMNQNHLSPDSYIEWAAAHGKITVGTDGKRTYKMRMPGPDGKPMTLIGYGLYIDDEEEK